MIGYKYYRAFSDGVTEETTLDRVIDFIEDHWKNVVEILDMMKAGTLFTSHMGTDYWCIYYFE